MDDVTTKPDPSRPESLHLRSEVVDLELDAIPAGLVQAITDAVSAGEVRELDPELAATALAGAVFYRRLMTSAPLAPASAPDLVRTVLGPPPTTS